MSAQTALKDFRTKGLRKLCWRWQFSVRQNTCFHQFWSDNVWLWPSSTREISADELTSLTLDPAEKSFIINRLRPSSIDILSPVIILSMYEKPVWVCHGLVQVSPFYSSPTSPSLISITWPIQNGVKNGLYNSVPALRKYLPMSTNAFFF